MTERNQNEFNRKVEGLLETPGVIVANVTFYPHICRRQGSPSSKLQLRGHYIGTRKGYPLVFEPEDVYHYMGVHDCLCLLLRQPRYATDMLSQAKDLPVIEPFGKMIWLGAVNAGTPSKKFKNRRVYIPSTVWVPPVNMRGRRMRTHAIIRTIKGPNKPFKYVVMEFPAFHRNGIVSRYVNDDDE